MISSQTLPRASEHPQVGVSVKGRIPAPVLFKSQLAGRFGCLRISLYEAVPFSARRTPACFWGWAITLGVKQKQDHILQDVAPALADALTDGYESEI